MIESPYLNKKDLLIISHPNGATNSFHFVHNVTQETKISGVGIIALLVKSIEEYDNSPLIDCCSAILIIKGITHVMVFNGLMKMQDETVFLEEIHRFFNRNKVRDEK